MSAWWRNLSARERLLITVAGALAGAVMVSLGVLQPLQAWRSSAESNVRIARDGYELTAAAAAVAGGAPLEAESSQESLRQIFVSSAAASGLEIVRIGSEVNGQLEVQIAPVDGDVFFTWIARLEADHGLTLTFADIARAEESRVSAQVLAFERR